MSNESPTLSPRHMRGFAKAALFSAGLYLACTLIVLWSGDRVDWSQSLRLPAAMIFLSLCLFLLSRAQKKGGR